jgi:hypothetical protein
MIVRNFTENGFEPKSVMELQFCSSVDPGNRMNSFGWRGKGIFALRKDKMSRREQKKKPEQRERRSEVSEEAENGAPGGQDVGLLS